MIIKLYDTVIFKENGKEAVIVEIDDNGGMSPPVYTLEFVNKSDDDDFFDAIIFCEERDFVPIEKHRQMKSVRLPKKRVFFNTLFFCAIIKFYMSKQFY